MKFFKKKKIVLDKSIFWETEYAKNTSLFLADVGVKAIDGLNPKMIQLLGFWDTGASECAIAKEIIKELNIKPYKIGVETTSMNGSSKNDIYLMDIFLTPTMLFKNIEVQATNFENHPCRFLIGNNIIKKGNLSFINMGDYFVARFERKEFD